MAEGPGESAARIRQSRAAEMTATASRAAAIFLSKFLDKGAACPNNKRLRSCNCISGGVLKRPTRADCKSAGLRLRRFESYPLHQCCCGEVVKRAGRRV